MPALYFILKQGGIAPGGFNFDSKVRRQSIEPVDLLLGHIGGIDACAAALVAATNLIEDGKFDAMREERYAGWNAPRAQAMLKPGANLEAIANRVAEDKIDPKPRSGRQELFENLLQPLPLTADKAKRRHSSGRLYRILVVQGQNAAPRREGDAAFGAGMIKVAVLFAIGALAVAMLAPAYLPGAAAPPAAAGPAAAQPADEPAPRAAEREASGFRETALQADSRGQYAVDTLVNGAPVRMMVDTGATVVAISASTAARLGLIAGPGPKWTIRTANGETKASPVTLDTVSFGGLYLRDVQALILAPEAGEVNLLGASFLKRLVSVEQRDGIMILRQ